MNEPGLRRAGEAKQRTTGPRNPVQQPCYEEREGVLNELRLLAASQTIFCQ